MPKEWCWDRPPGSGWLAECAPQLPVVWQVWLTDAPARLGGLMAMLTADERARLARFRLPPDQQRFAIGRGLLRLLLGAHLRLPPESVPLGRGSFGKPFVSTGPGKPAISFNVAHSGQLVLLAFHSGREVGVDVEAVRPDLDCEPLAEQVFSPAEKRDWQRLDTAARPRAFFRAWTRHEARLKATGSGLVGPDIEGNTCERFELQLPAGYEGALALRCEV